MCPYCSEMCTRYGKSASGNQRYRCKDCKKTHSRSYVYKACNKDTGTSVTEHLKEGCGIRSIARLLRISCSTVLKKIVCMANALVPPAVVMGKSYEVDEVCTFVKKRSNLIWIAYALRRDTCEVTAFAVGRRTNVTLRAVTDTLILSSATRVYTDKLPQYASLLPQQMHHTTRYGTNRIERNNLSLRTHLKRLSRKTICFSKSLSLLRACLTIYFWG